MPLAGAGEELLTIDGPVGPLEARVMGADALRTGSVGAIVCHPHSMHGGSLQNKVVHTLCRVFRDLDVPSVRFNFRGVGRSGGKYDEGIGETDDLLAVLAWMESQTKLDAVWLAGFSFGAFVAARAARNMVDSGRPLSRLVLVAPSVENFSMDGLLPVPVPTVVAWGDEDEVVDPAAIGRWAAGLDPAPQQLRFSGVGHFFHGSLPQLKDRLVESMRNGGS